MLKLSFVLDITLENAQAYIRTIKVESQLKKSYQANSFLVKFSCRFIFVICFFIFALGRPPSASAETAAYPTSNSVSLQPTNSLSTSIQYCLPQDNQYTIENIRGCIFESRKDLPLFKLAHAEFWIKISARSDALMLHRLLVNIRPHFLYEIALYEPKGDGWHKQQAGSRFTSRQPQSTLGGYSFVTSDLSTNETELFMHIRTSGLIYSAISIEPFDLYPVNKNKQPFEIGMQIGAQAFVLLFLMIAHILNPSLKLGRFTLLMAVVLLCTLSGSGLLSHYLFPDYPELDSLTFLGLFFLRIIGWVWVAQGILNRFQAPEWYNTTCSLFYGTMFAGLMLNSWGMNTLGGALMLCAFLVTHFAQIIAASRTSNIPTVFKATLLIAFIVSDLILVLTLLLTQYPIVSPTSAIYFSRIGDFVQPLILLFVILVGGRLVLTELNNTKAHLRDLAHQTDIERALLNERKILVDMLTHEIRTPLGSIRLAIDSIKKYFSPNNATDLKRFNNISLSLKNIHNIIEHCSLMNQVDQQVLEVNQTRINLNECIKQYISALDDASLNRLHFKLSTQVTAHSDGYILKIIFTNLIENALKYSPDKSIIYVSTYLSDSKNQTIYIEVSNQLVQSNIPDLSLIFDRYYRSPLVKNISGTGLGLHLSQLLSIRLGGQLTAIIDKGMITFSLSLPHTEPS